MELSEGSHNAVNSIVYSLWERWDWVHLVVCHCFAYSTGQSSSSRILWQVKSKNSEKHLSTNLTLPSLCWNPDLRSGRPELRHGQLMIWLDALFLIFAITFVQKYLAGGISISSSIIKSWEVTGLSGVVDKAASFDMNTSFSFVLFGRYWMNELSPVFYTTPII